jgi:hypothetical protein
MPPKRDQTDANRRYYWANRSAEIQRVRSRQAAARAFLAEIKARPCTDCGQRYAPHQMDFDHRDPATKTFWLSRSTALLARRDRLLAEIAKCDVVCANCHRTRSLEQHRQRLAARGSERSTHPKTTYLRARWRRDLDFLNAIRDTPCADCRVRFPPWVMEFDHIVPSTKRMAVTRMIGRSSLRRMLAEIDLCDIVCSNCHRDRTSKRRGEAEIERE